MFFPATPSWLTGRAGDIYIESTLLATSAELFVLAREDLLEPLVNGMSRVAAFVEEKERIIPLIKEVRPSACCRTEKLIENRMRRC